jgi:hypothetical protein
MSVECDENEFSCDGGHCIQLSQVCDLISDCADGTDEFCGKIINIIDSQFPSC